MFSMLYRALEEDPEIVDLVRVSTKRVRVRGLCSSKTFRAHRGFPRVSPGVKGEVAREKDDRLAERRPPHAGAGCRLHDTILLLRRI